MTHITKERLEQARYEAGAFSIEWENCSDWIKRRAAELSAQDASPKDGWKLVPIEPTQEMCKAGLIVHNSACTAYQVYDAMIAAAPETPKQCAYGEFDGFKEICTKVATVNRRGYHLCKPCADLQLAAEIKADMDAEAFYDRQRVSAQDASPKDGWKLVPVELTREIALAMENTYFADPKPISIRSIEFAIWQQVYKAMLAAAPEVPK